MKDIVRRSTRRIHLGGIPIGGSSPISIQSMLSVKTANLPESSRQIRELVSAGCDIIRFSVTDLDDAKAIRELKKVSAAPLVADIHYDYRLALASISAGVDGLRINPGNIGKRAYPPKVYHVTILNQGIGNSELAEQQVAIVILRLDKVVGIAFYLVAFQIVGSGEIGRKQRILTIVASAYPKQDQQYADSEQNRITYEHQ